MSSRTLFRKRVGKSVAWSTLDVVLGRMGQFAQGVVVARIVAPKQFGVFAIALVVHSIVIGISELGVSAALIRDDREELRARGQPPLRSASSTASSSAS